MNLKLTDLGRAFERAALRLSVGSWFNPIDDPFEPRLHGRRKRAKARKVERQNKLKGRRGH